MKKNNRTSDLTPNPIHPYYITRRYIGQRNARDVVAQLIRAHGDQH